MKHCFQCYSSKSLQYLGFLLHIQKIKKATSWFWSQKVNGQPSCDFLVTPYSWQNIFTPLITDTSDFVKIWMMMIGRHSEHWRTKRFLVTVINACFPIELCVNAFFLVICASISTPCMRFVNKVWWTFYMLEFSLSIASNILHTYHPKVEISCKSCNSFKSTYRSFASLNLVQSRQSY